MLSFNRQISFSSGFELYDPGRTAEENRALFGPDSGKKLAGSFLLDAHFIREGFPAIDPLTGMMVSLVDVDKWMNELKEKLTSDSLNTVLDPWVPTLEQIARFAAGELVGAVSQTYFDQSTESGSMGTSYSGAGHLTRLHRLKLSMQESSLSGILRSSVSLHL